MKSELNPIKSLEYDIPLNPTKSNKTRFLQVNISQAERAQPINNRAKSQAYLAGRHEDFVPTCAACPAGGRDQAAEWGHKGL